MRGGLAGVYPRLWRFCLVLTRDRSAADDLAQKTCARALEKAGGFTPGTHLDRWLFTLARRVWLNDIRSQTVRRGAGLVAIEDAALADPRADTEMNTSAREVLDLIGALPDGQREAVLLVYVEGYSYKEAATHLEIPIGTVMSRLATARRTIAPNFTERD